ncbi:aldehyde dehydrogenase family protein [Piscinibacter sakaiensis]|uniref:aldehyde dehydrogenase family protein n=1 Tax=Piscinibacter sakaiensis TaxID=1547922 RepID=UPI003AABA353
MDLPETMTALPSTQILIDGRRLDGDGLFAVDDRFTQQPLAQVHAASRMQVADAVRVARRACAAIPPPYERAQILRRAAQLISQQRQRLIELTIAEAGFTVAEAQGELLRALDTLELCAEEAKRISGEMMPLDGNPGQHNRIGFSMREPVGIVCAITPFNSPLNAVLHKLGPAIAAGNAVLFKPSGYTPLTASLICDLLLEAGWPAGAIALLHGLDGQVGSWLLDEPDIDFYAFTGSTRVGRLIQAAAGLRRTQLELGSIACTIVCADADIDGALPKLARASFRKAGQVCTSIQRLYVEAPLADEVLHRLSEAAAAMPAGDPRDARTQVGPMITQAQAERAETWIAEALQGGARLGVGGGRTCSVLQPTVLDQVRPGMKVVDEEIFAPVVSVIPFADLQAAIREVNATPFGLAAGIFTRNLGSAFAAARLVKAGAVHINETSSSRADAMSYGGVKASGFGREGPRFAIREMTDEKVVTVSL